MYKCIKTSQSISTDVLNVSQIFSSFDLSLMSSWWPAERKSFQLYHSKSSKDPHHCTPHLSNTPERLKLIKDVNCAVKHCDIRVTHEHCGQRCRTSTDEARQPDLKSLDWPVDLANVQPWSDHWQTRQARTIRSSDGQRQRRISPDQQELQDHWSSDRGCEREKHKLQLTDYKHHGCKI